MSKKKQSNPLLPIGFGIGIGACSLWAIAELWPLLIIGGAGYLVVKGLENQYNNSQESNQCETGPQKK